MTVFFNKARQRWQYDFRRGGQRFAGYCVDPTGVPAASRRAALDAEAKIKAAAGKAGSSRTAPTGYTLAQCFADWIEKVARHRRDWPNKRRYLRELLAFYGAGMSCEAIDENQLDRFVEASRKKSVPVYVGGPAGGGSLRAGNRLRSDATTNRYLSELRAALNRAKSRKLIRFVPDFDMLDEPRGSPNPVRPADVDKIAAAAPLHLRRVVLLKSLTGMRLTECTHLRWQQVFFEDRAIRLDMRTKGKKGRTIPLCRQALALLREMHGERPAGQDRVFLYRHKNKGTPRPFNNPRRAWATALRCNGLSGAYRQHDLRSHFCSRLAALGADPATIQELAGHVDIKTTMRYVKADADTMRSAVDRLGADLTRRTKTKTK